MNSTYWNRLFSAKSVRPVQDDRLRRYLPRVEKMEDRALLTTLTGVATETPHQGVPAVVARREVSPREAAYGEESPPVEQVFLYDVSPAKNS